MGNKPRLPFFFTLALSTAMMLPVCLAQRAGTDLVPGEAKTGRMDTLDTSRARSGVEDAPIVAPRPDLRLPFRTRQKYSPEYMRKLKELDNSFNGVSIGLPTILAPDEMAWLKKYEGLIELAKSSGCIALVSGMIAINRSAGELMTSGQVGIQAAFENAARANTRAGVGMAGLCEQMADCTNGAQYIVACPSVT